MLLLLLLVLGLAESVAATALPEPVTPGTRLLVALCLAWPVMLFAVNGLQRSRLRDVFQLYPVSLAQAATAGLAALALSLVLLSLVSWIPGPPPESATELHGKLAASNRFALLLAILLVGPVFEELFFRGWMQPIWVLRFGSPTAVVVTSLFFSLLHIAGWKILFAFPVGLLLGWIALRCRSVWPAVVGHVAANAGTFVLDALLRVVGYSAADIDAMDSVPVALPVVAFAAFVAAVVMHARVTRASPAA